MQSDEDRQASIRAQSPQRPPRCSFKAALGPSPPVTSPLQNLCPIAPDPRTPISKILETQTAPPILPYHQAAGSSSDEVL